MFEYLVRFSKILVTGPQRSGTTICAVMIAKELGYTFYPEEKVNVSDLGKAKELFRREEGLVLQCPALMRYAHEFSATDVAIILLRRSVEDIIASEKRIGWIHAPIELARYGRTSGVISEIKYEYWDKYQVRRIENLFVEIGYESLASHPLWVPKERRANFGARQIEESD